MRTARIAAALVSASAPAPSVRTVGQAAGGAVRHRPPSPRLPAGRRHRTVARFRTPLGGRRCAPLIVLLAAAPRLATAAPVPVTAVTVRAPEVPGALSETPGQTDVDVGSSAYGETSALTAGDMLLTAPGVTTIGGNGPRDVSISVRGSNDRQAYGIRNVVVYDDGFPVTQPDGMARADLVDPHAYSSVDVVEGPSSTRFGNYATGGAIDFVTTPPAAIDGVVLGSEFGSFDTLNQWLEAGGRLGPAEGTIFGSNVRGDGFIANSRYDTSTENALATFDLTPSDRVAVKVINNVTDTLLPVRLSLDQYELNPYQTGCTFLRSAGCGSVALHANGRNGRTVVLSPEQAGLGRFDRRTIAAVRWTHDVDDTTNIRTQVVFDDRSIDQPSSSSSYGGDYPSLDGSVELTRRGTVFGLPSTTLLGADANGLRVRSLVYDVTPAGGATLGALTQLIDGTQWNAGGHLEERLELTPRIDAVFGIGGEISAIDADEVNYAYPIAGGISAQSIDAGRHFGDVAPEASVVWTATDATTLHLRVGTGYGTPYYGQLFTTEAGSFGDNTVLKPETNVGVDLGLRYAPTDAFSLSVTGFYEFYSNELVTQSAGVDLQSYTFNAPASQHRGIEVGLDWEMLPRSAPGLRLTVDELTDDQIYTDYTEQLSSAAATASFDRAGRRIPGVVPNNVDARLLYDRRGGELAGIGGFAEIVWRDAFPLDNANLLDAPSSTLTNVELHYDPPKGLGALSRTRIFLEVLNVLDVTTVGSASNITDQISSAGVENGAAVLAATTGSIYAGTPRSFFGGVRMRF